MNSMIPRECLQTVRCTYFFSYFLPANPKPRRPVHSSADHDVASSLKELFASFNLRFFFPITSFCSPRGPSVSRNAVSGVWVVLHSTCPGRDQRVGSHRRSSEAMTSSPLTMLLQDSKFAPFISHICCPCDYLQSFGRHGPTWRRMDRSSSMSSSLLTC